VPPPIFRRRNYGGGHAYYLVDGDTETHVPGVTTILSDALPKQLKQWAADESAEYAIAHWEELGKLRPFARAKAIANAWQGELRTASIRGTTVHALAERLQRGEQVEMPEGYEGHVEACVAFLDDYDVQGILAEASVLHRENPLYGGTLDLVGDMLGHRWLIDWKTSKSGVYAEAALQLSAYAHADVYIDDDGDEHPVKDLGIERGAVVHLRADGYDVYPMNIGDRPFEVFRVAAYMAGWLHYTKGEGTRLDTFKLPALQRVQGGAA
jgi:hypothetical protein